MRNGEEGARGWAGYTAPVLSVGLHSVHVPKLHLLLFSAELRGGHLPRLLFRMTNPLWVRGVSTSQE